MKSLRASCVLSLLFFFLLYCQKKPAERNSAVQFREGLVHVDSDSEFLKLVSTGKATAVPGGTKALQAIGQIVLLSIPSGSLMGDRVSAVQLDPVLSAHFALDARSFRLNSAVGIVELPVAYRDQIRVGAPVRAAMYGLRRAEAPASVQSIHLSSDGTYITVVFVIQSAPEWYPGASCRMLFPRIRSEPAVIEARALVHYGKQDYVFLEQESNTFRPVPVVVLEEKGHSMQVLGIHPDQVLMVRGALLLKPFLAELEGKNENR